MSQVSLVGIPKNVTATGTVSAFSGRLLGFYVNSTSSGTIALNTQANKTPAAISGTITPAIGWHKFPAVYTDGLSVTIGGTLNVTLFVQEGL